MTLRACAQMLNFLDEAASREPVSSIMLYTRFDALALGRIVGADRADALLSEAAKPTVMFC